jgi:hypothetical protein
VPTAQGLQIAAGNAPNLADPVTGTWGKVLLDPLNSYMTATLAILHTLGKHQLEALNWLRALLLYSRV